MSPLSLLFFGIQGAGKGTQVQKLKDFLGQQSDRPIIHVDVGAELRELRDTGSYTGKLTGAVLDAGRRMPDFMPIHLLTRRLVHSFTGEEHILADGIARGNDQTRAFDDAMVFYGRIDYQIISIELSEASVLERLRLRHRNDDTEEGIRNRLAWYKTDVLPQIELLRGRGRTIHSIDGEPDVETVHQSVLRALKFV